MRRRIGIKHFANARNNGSVRDMGISTRRQEMPQRTISMICIIASLISIIGLVGCGGAKNSGAENYRIPGYIQIQTFPMGADEAVEVRNILLDLGYAPIVTDEFHFDVSTYDGRESLYKGICVSEEYPLLYWHDLQTSIRGRNITSQDVDDHERVCVISVYDESDIFGVDASAIGKSIIIEGEDFEVIGVIEGDEAFNMYFSGSIFIPFTSASYIVKDGEYMELIWIDDGRDLSVEAGKIFKVLFDRGYDSNVTFLGEDKEPLGTYR